MIKQRNAMRGLVAMFGDNVPAITQTYAFLEDKGLVERRSNLTDMSAQNYAVALFCDGARKGWFDSEITAAHVARNGGRMPKLQGALAE